MWKPQVARRMCGTAPQCTYTWVTQYTYIYMYMYVRTHVRVHIHAHEMRCRWNRSGSLGAFVVLVQLFCQKLFQFLWTLLSTGKGFSSRCPHLPFSNLETAFCCFTIIIKFNNPPSCLKIERRHPALVLYTICIYRVLLLLSYYHCCCFCDSHHKHGLIYRLQQVSAYGRPQ